MKLLRYASRCFIPPLAEILIVLQNELVLAVYEVGQCFFRGWGVVKDKEMGVVSQRIFSSRRKVVHLSIQSYFKTAAQLGDPDAQQDLAFCLANGKGCKKDKKEAAKWYRAAVSHGFLGQILRIHLIFLNAGRPRREYSRLGLDL